MKLLTGRQLVSHVQLEIQQCDCADLAKALKANAIVIDIREESEVILGMVPGATHIPRGVLEMEITSHISVKNTENPIQSLATKAIYLYCRSGARSALSAKSLRDMGLNNVWSVAGGFADWQAQDRPIISNKEANVWEMHDLFAWEQGGGI